jgi:hypothetical protein
MYADVRRSDPRKSMEAQTELGIELALDLDFEQMEPPPRTPDDEALF